MKKLLISLIVVCALSTPALAEHRIETATNVVEVTVHVDGGKKPWKKKLPLGRPSKTVLKPCPNNNASDCLYVIDRTGKEKEIFSFTADDLNWVNYKTEFTIAQR